MSTALDAKLTSKLLFLDVSKAFDRVWHKALLSKLETLGIGDSALRWFSSYLSGRYQRVVLNGIESRWKEITAGVPQGSIMGPLLYIIFTRDVVNGMETCLKLYADDSLLMASGRTEEDCARKMQPDIERISRWAKNHKIKLNATKTKTLTITRTERGVYPLFMDGEFIEEVMQHIHLGVTLQRNGRWSKNIEAMINKANQRLYLLRKYTRYFNRKTLKQLYISYIRPLVEYGSQVWTYITVHESNSLEEIQRAACRIITGLKIGTSHEKLKNELDLEDLSYRRYVARMTTLHDIINSEIPNRLNRWSLQMVRDRNPYNTRRAGDFSFDLPRTEHQRNSFLQTAIREWNSIPESVKSLSTRSALKCRLKHRSRPNSYFSFELSRMSGVNHARLRSGNCNLNQNLCRIGLAESPMCECGREDETVVHFLLVCPRYDRLRREITSKIPLEAWNLRTILYGSDRYSQELNLQIAKTVQLFITATARF